MAPTVGDLMGNSDSEDDEEGEDGGITVDGKPLRGLLGAYKGFDTSAITGAFASKAQAMLDDMNARNADVFRAVAETANIEARRRAAEAAALRDAQRASVEARDLAKLHQVELEALRKESDAAARRYFVYGVAVGAGFVVVSWLLSALSAAQVLSHLFHP